MSWTKNVTTLNLFCLQLHILVSPTKVKLNLDCQEVADKEIKEAGNTSTDGYQVLGKMSKSIGSKGKSATVSELSYNVKAYGPAALAAYKQVSYSTHVYLSAVMTGGSLEAYCLHHSLPQVECASVIPI